jgi:hypothetical protein
MMLHQAVHVSTNTQIAASMRGLVWREIILYYQQPYPSWCIGNICASHDSHLQCARARGSTPRPGTFFCIFCFCYAHLMFELYSDSLAKDNAQDATRPSPAQAELRRADASRNTKHNRVEQSALRAILYMKSRRTSEKGLCCFRFDAVLFF